VKTVPGLFVAVCLFSAAGLTQVAKTANQNYKDEAGRSKIAATLTDEGRDARQKPKELISQLGVRPGMTVADIGTGPGYMLPHLSAAVGPSGVVYAEDIFPDFLNRAKVNAQSLQNVKFFLGNEKSVELPAATVDLAMILDAYHHFDYPEAMLASIKRALKPDGRLAIVEYHKNEKSMANGNALTHIRKTRADFVKEIEGYGFQAVQVADFVPDVQWFGIFQPKQ